MADSTLKRLGRVAETRWGLVTTAQAPRGRRRRQTAVANGIGRSRSGRLFLDGFDFIVPARKGTRLPGVRLRVRHLTHDEVFGVAGLPTLTIERTIADLVERSTDLSLVASVVRDAGRADRLVASERLVAYLDPIASRRTRGAFADGASLAHELFEMAGVAPHGWHRG